MASNSLSKGQLNFTILAIACVNEIPVVFSDILESRIKPDQLNNKIQSCLKLTTGDYQLNPRQLQTCSNNATDYKKFDVTLLYKLIRNLCLNNEPKKKKGKITKSNMRNIEDAIECLRRIRNDAYAHTTSSEVSDEEFAQYWDDLEKSIHKIHTFMESLGKEVNYKEELATIKKTCHNQDDLDKYKFLLEGFVMLSKQFENIDVPTIIVKGNGEILCGEKACFEAVRENCPVNNNWPITWERVRGKSKEEIDISEKKYDGSSSIKLVIPRVLKEDAGEYQAVISRDVNGNRFLVLSSMFRLDALGDPPNLKIHRVITEANTCITIFYNVEKTSPIVEKIEWTKGKEPLTTNTPMYKGGGITDNHLTILSPSENNSGEYTCTVTNAVGSDMKKIVLAAPSVEICEELKVPLGGCVTINPVIQSCPSLSKVIWQKSKAQTPDNFMTIDIDDARYFGSSLDKENPFLVINRANHDDNLFYRLKVANGIGMSTSNAVLLKLVGDYPSVFTYHETRIQDRSVRLLCKVSLSDDSPEVTGVVWRKDKKDIEISSSGGKFVEESTGTSLLIHRVNSNDTGEYQCRVTNAVGCMLGNPIYLGKPIVQIGSPERDEKSDEIIYHATIESIPEALKAEWRVQQTPEDDFQPIDIHDSSYRGSTVSLPHPSLTVHGYSLKQGLRFEIRVTNFIGETREVIYDKKIPNEDHDHKAHNKQMDFYRKRGSKIPFANLRDDLENSFPQNELERLKNLLIDQEAITEDSVSACNSLREVLGILIQEGLFSICDVILVQYLLRKIGCRDLYDKCYDYAQACEALCFYEKQPENGFTTVKFHIFGNFKDYSKEDIYFIRDTVAKMVNCPEADVFISGLEHDKSFVVLLSIKEEYTNVLLLHAQDILERLRSLNVDYLVCGEIVFRKENIIKASAVISKEVTPSNFSTSVPKEVTPSVVLDDTNTSVNREGESCRNIKEKQTEESLVLEQNIIKTDSALQIGLSDSPEQKNNYEGKNFKATIPTLKNSDVIGESMYEKKNIKKEVEYTELSTDEKDDCIIVMNDAKALLIHCDEDRSAAELFLADTQRSFQDIIALSIDDFCTPGKSYFDILNEIAEGNNFILVWVTKNLKKHKEFLNIFLTDIVLTESKSNIERKDRIIPIWGEPNAKTLFNKLRPFAGFHYHERKDDFLELQLIIDEARDRGFDDLR